LENSSEKRLEKIKLSFPGTLRNPVQSSVYQERGGGGGKDEKSQSKSMKKEKRSAGML